VVDEQERGSGNEIESGSGTGAFDNITSSNYGASNGGTVNAVYTITVTGAPPVAFNGWHVDGPVLKAEKPRRPAVCSDWIQNRAARESRDALAAGHDKHGGRKHRQGR